MTIRSPLSLAAAALALLAAAPGCASRGTAPASTAAAAAPPPSADDAEAVLPGVDLEGLEPAARRSVAELALSEFCPCGCPHTISACLRGHDTCSHSKRAARLAVRLARLGILGPDLRRGVSMYYASFDSRRGPDPASWGPPLGDAAAKITLLEISDFTCPFCRKLRPDLEAFVQARPGRVKLVYVPFAIESHPGALQAAQIGEWAREAGVFWPTHDALFEAAHPLNDDAVDGLAREVGGDPDALRAALAEERYLPRVRAGQAVGRAAGIKGTPTLFLNGRQLVIPDYSEAALEDALVDEEEWVTHGGWAKD